MSAILSHAGTWCRLSFEAIARRSANGAQVNGGKKLVLNGSAKASAWRPRLPRFATLFRRLQPMLAQARCYECASPTILREECAAPRLRSIKAQYAGSDVIAV